MRAILLATLVALFLSAGTTKGQVAIRATLAPATPYSAAAATVSSGATASGQAVPVGAASAGSAPAAANTVQQGRLEKIRQLTFDRRPSTILKTWIEPPPKEPAPPAEKPAAGTKEIEKAAETNDDKPTEASPAAETAEPAEAAPAADADPNATPAAETPATDTPAAEAAPSHDEAAKQARLKAEQEQKAAADEKAEEEKAAAAAAAQLRADQLFDYQLKLFQRHVTLGEWPEVKAFLASLEESESSIAYGRLLDVLRSPFADPQQQAQMQAMQQQMAAMANMGMQRGGQNAQQLLAEKNLFTMSDIAGLVTAAPQKPDDDALGKLGAILRMALASGYDLEEFLRLLHLEKDAAEPSLISRHDAAVLLFAANEEIKAGEYLATLEVAQEAQDLPELNLIARHCLALYDKDKKGVQLEQAWNATQAALGVKTPEIPAAEPAPATAAPNAADAPGGAATPVTTPAPAVAEKPAVDPQVAAAEKRKQEEIKLAAKLKSEKEAALSRGVELAPRVKAELGQKWLDESFTSQIERGKEILATIGAQISKNLLQRASDLEFRQRSIELQHTAVESLLRAAPQAAAEWHDVLTVLAANWLREAEVSYRLDQDANSPRGWQRDRYGNYFYIDNDGSAAAASLQQAGIRPIRTADLLDARPSDAWLARISADLKPKFCSTFAQLHLKVSDDAKAFPYVEQLAATHPDKARELAEEFLRVWTRNHNPNEGRESNPYIYYYGYERRADRIPLTRSKQERNLKELTAWVVRLRAMPIGDLDETLLTRAFTTAHSAAEVYRLEAIENVFGSMERLKPRTLAELIQQMRGNLAGVWQLPAVQQKNSTNRKQRDMQAEVLRGYDVARKAAAQGLAKHPDDWALTLAEAAVMYDENDFHQQLEHSSEFSARRNTAFERFQRAAELYANALPSLTQDEQSTQVHEQWFYASLGAVDLARVTSDKTADLKQPAKIREAMAALTGEAAEFHLAKFANNLFTRLNDAKAEQKFRYLKSGFEIVGDHKMAREARKVLDYYNDLVTEIKLETKVDGPDVVGHGQPFGVFVNIVHTKEIERESGGFGKYLQNQNNANSMYFYNYGRPTENYRDRFRDMVNLTLGEQYEVLSVTFQNAEVNSKALPEYGWRVTPYAYLLLKARGPEVDKLPPLKMDFDFLDTSGYAILPVESPTLPIDARPAAPPVRPVDDITLTQTLDERQADDGKLVLEIRATARGLTPELAQLVDLRPAGFRVIDTDDNGVSAAEFDKDSAESQIRSERVWLVTLKSDAAAEQRPKEFQFATAKLPVKEAIYQRYDDADLLTVEPVVSLERQYAEANYAWLGFAAAGALGLLGLGILAWKLASQRHEPESSRYQLPEQLTPFAALGVLRDIQRNDGLSEPEKRELKQSIEQLERHYFAASAASEEPELRTIAEHWIGRSHRH